MVIGAGWQDKSRAYLMQALTDWATANSLTPNVKEGIVDDGIAGTLAAPVLYVANAPDTPGYNDDGYLLTGHIVSYRIKTAARGDAQEDRADIAESIINYVMDCVVRHTPTSGTILSANSLSGPPPWLLVNIEPNIMGIGADETGYDWQGEITFMFTNAVTNRRLGP